MTSILEKFSELTDKLNNMISIKDENLEKIIQAADQIGKTWSGSWIGYHSRVYYKKFNIPPRWAFFSQEWGFVSTITGGTTGEWVRYKEEEVKAIIYKLANISVSIEILENKRIHTQEVFEEVQYSLLSLIETIPKFKEFSISKKQIKFIEDLKILTPNDFVNPMIPSNPISRDSEAYSQGIQCPPHLEIKCHAFALRYPFDLCWTLKKEIQKIIIHVKNMDIQPSQKEITGHRVFIGHGRSEIWRELKDFIEDRLKLPWDEFNRISPVGKTNTERLSEMLNKATFALLVMTAEDEQPDGTFHPRKNVIHELGLFQREVGFEKAIILLEDGCEEPSNIHGLVQIRFPKDHIRAAFEEIRRVLEREGIIKV